MEQAYRLYPFLKGYAQVEKTICRTVFNPATESSEQGNDRRVREIIGGDQVTDDGRIRAYRAPKWTNAELVAMMAVNDTVKALGGQSLPVDDQKGFGPEKLDVENITQTLHFKDMQANPTHALNYVHRHHLPEAMVDTSSPFFVAGRRSAQDRATVL